MHVVLLLVFGLEVACVVVAAARLHGIHLGRPQWVELVALPVFLVEELDAEHVLLVVTVVTPLLWW